MEMMKKMANFLDNYASAFFVGSLSTNKVIYLNKKAKTLFDVTAETCDFGKIFDRSSKRIEQVMQLMLECGQNTIIYNFIAIKPDKTKIVVDLQLGYFDEEKTEIFLELIPQNDTRMQMALNQIDQSTRPEAILNIDEKLSIIHCNEFFHSVFDSDEQLCKSHFNNDLINGFSPDVRESLINDILNNLKKSTTYETKLKVYTTTSEEHWYLLELERRTLDNSGTDKIIAYLTNIEKEVELEEEYTILKECLDTIQELTNDIVYHVDVKTGILYHNIKSPTENLIGKSIKNHIEVLVKQDLIHPDDIDNYINYITNWYNSDTTENADFIIRVAIFKNEFSTYRVRGKKLYDNNNKFTTAVCIMELLND